MSSSRMTDAELDACRRKYDKEYFEYIFKTAGCQVAARPKNLL
jgi:hypothetical protein